MDRSQFHGIGRGITHVGGVRTLRAVIVQCMSESEIPFFLGSIGFAHEAAIPQSVHGTHGVLTVVVRRNDRGEHEHTLLDFDSHQSAFGPEVKSGLVSRVLLCLCEDACPGKSDQGSWTARGGWDGVGAFVTRELIAPIG